MRELIIDWTRQSLEHRLDPILLPGLDGLLWLNGWYLSMTLSSALLGKSDRVAFSLFLSYEYSIAEHRRGFTFL